MVRDGRLIHPATTPTQRGWGQQEKLTKSSSTFAIRTLRFRFELPVQCSKLLTFAETEKPLWCFRGGYQIVKFYASGVFLYAGNCDREVVQLLVICGSDAF